jgi:prepilin-type N-terminal cleavage/methylation domain-containing protein
MAKNNKQAGFSLIELLIVVAIIGIIAAIAIPNLLASRRAANEGSAISSVRTLVTSQMTYQSTGGNGVFADTNKKLMDSGLVDSSLGLADTAGATPKSGYTIETKNAATTPDEFFVTANPSTTTGVTQTGTRRFGAYQDGVVRTDTASLSTAYTLTTVKTANPLN